jgi:hypothetical protein
MIIYITLLSTQHNNSNTWSLMSMMTHFGKCVPSSSLIFRFSLSLTLTLWSWVPLERPQVVQPLGSFTVFYGTRRFITTITRALHLYLSWARPIQSTTLNPISKRPILMLSIQLHLIFLVVSFHLAFLPITYTHSSSPPFMPHVPPISSLTLYF